MNSKAIIIDTLELMNDMYSQSLDSCPNTSRCAMAQLDGVKDKMHGLLIEWLNTEVKIMKTKHMDNTASLDELVSVARPLAYLKGLRHNHISFFRLRDIALKFVIKDMMYFKKKAIINKF